MRLWLPLMSKLIFVRRSIFCGNIPFWVIPFFDTKAGEVKIEGEGLTSTTTKALARTGIGITRSESAGRGRQRGMERVVQRGTVQDIHQQRVVSSTAKGIAASSTRSSSA